MRTTHHAGVEESVIVGAFVFGLSGRGLRDVIVNAPPTLGPILGDLTQLSFVDHARHSDESFRRFRRRKLRVPDERLEEIWNRGVAERRGESFALAEEDAALAKSYRVGPLADPCLVLNTDPPSGENIIVSFPVSSFAGPRGQDQTLKVLAEAFDERILRVAWEQGGGTLASLRRVLESRARMLQGALVSIAAIEKFDLSVQASGRRRARVEVESGWVSASGAQDKYDVRRSTLHDIKNSLQRDRDWKKHTGSGVILYRIEALETELRRRGRLR